MSAERSVGLFDLAARLPALLMDAPMILRGTLTGLLVLPTSKASIATVFQDRAGRYGDRVFIRFGDQAITYRQANETANRYAAVLAGRGVGRRDVVGLMLRNSPDTVLTMLAVAKLGAVAGMLNHHQRAEVLAHSIGLLGATVVVCEADLIEPIAESGAETADLLTVQNIDFDTTEAAAAQAQLEAAAASSSSSSGGIVGLLKIVFTALIILVSLFFAWSSIRKAGKGDVTSTIDLRELEVVREELRELTKGSIALPASGESGIAALPAADPFSLDPIAPSRAAMMANHIEGEISELIDAQPDEVALLLRNWLAERRIPAKR